MVVVIIIGILAAVAVPKISANRKRAIASEAEAGCGVIRHHLAIMDVAGAEVVSGPVSALDNDYFSAELVGTYFSKECYELNFTDPNDWVITVTGDDTTISDSAAAGIVVTHTAAGVNTITF